ncbi:hypothetical protein [Pseudomonas parakoreensis]|jgi:hypothetical protein|uniref:hypothetical protein n=1 Tax=Pseudomonas parakoreensis TaxID=2892331 RepID=UPI00103E82A9|nr:hypothetical protein [Pseudomonas parakoreensis]
MTVNEVIFDDLWDGEKNICFFVHSEKCFWVVDEKENFTLDIDISLRAALESGGITKEQYEQFRQNYRGGLAQLTSENFPKYLDDSREKILSSLDLQSFVGADETVFEAIESYYLTGKGLSSELYKLANVVSSRLPTFYINFDRKIFMHMDDGRFHEKYVYSDWTSECYDFSFLIPARERYWIVDGRDYWKLRFV